MSARRYYNSNESHSFNLGVSPAGMVMAHAKPSPSLPAKERVAYEAYAAFSFRIGAPVMPFEKWYAKDSGVNSTDARVNGQFHRHDLIGRQASAPMPIYAHGAEYSGSYDNAIRALEGEAHWSDTRTGLER